MPDPGLDITHRPDLPALVARWLREVSPAELQAGYQAILAAADAHASTRWLLDLRRRNGLGNAAVNSWVAETFLPQLTGRYGQPVYVAYLVSPSRAAALPPVPAPAPDPRPATGYQFATFIDEAAAHHWLNPPGG